MRPTGSPARRAARASLASGIGASSVMTARTRPSFTRLAASVTSRTVWLCDAMIWIHLVMSCAGSISIFWAEDVAQDDEASAGPEQVETLLEHGRHGGPADDLERDVRPESVRDVHHGLHRVGLHRVHGLERAEFARLGEFFVLHVHGDDVRAQVAEELKSVQSQSPDPEDDGALAEFRSRHADGVKRGAERPADEGGGRQRDVVSDFDEIPL